MLEGYVIKDVAVELDPRGQGPSVGDTPQCVEWQAAASREKTDER